MTLASGGSPIFPLVVHWAAVQSLWLAESVHKSRGVSVGAVEEMMYVVYVSVTQQLNDRTKKQSN